MSTHIALIGTTEDPVLKGYQHYGGVKKLYLLHSPDSQEFKFKELALGVKKRLEGAGFDGVVLKQINAFDMNNIISTIIDIVDHEKPPYFVNITGGTNLMAGAACAASFFIGAKAYYVLGKRGEEMAESQVIELPVPNIPYYRTIDKSQLRVMEALSRLGGNTPNARLRDSLEMSPQVLSYHVKELSRKGLVNVLRGQVLARREDKKVDSRAITIELTNAGRLVLGWSSVGSPPAVGQKKR
jgi:DNA-binding transcriptional ArsR family regulator